MIIEDYIKEKYRDKDIVHIIEDMNSYSVILKNKYTYDVHGIYITSDEFNNWLIEKRNNIIDSI